MILGVGFVFGVATLATLLGYRSHRITTGPRLALLVGTAMLVGLALLQFYRVTPGASTAALVEPKPVAPKFSVEQSPFTRAMIEGSIDLRGLAPLAGCLALWLAAAGLARPRWGLYSLVFLVTLADEFVRDFSPWTLQLGLGMFQNWWKFLSPGESRRLGFLVVNNLEVGLGFIAVGLAARVAVRRKPRPCLPPELPFMLAYTAVLVWMFVYGIGAGGDLRPALWQVRGLAYFLALAALTPQVIETRAHLRNAIWALMIPIVFKALQINWRYFVDLGGSLGDARSMIGHEDSGLLAGAIVLGTALALYGVERAQRGFLLASLPALLLGLAFNVRRASYAALALSLGVMPLLLHGRRKAALKAAVPALALAAIYCAVFWNRPLDPLALPVQKAKSVFAPAEGTFDSTSNRYRRDEDIDLRMTILRHPEGLGFGHKFELHVPLDKIGHLYKQWQYNPHNTVLGLWISLGTQGVVAFLAYFGSIILFAAHGVRRQADVYLKAVCYFALTSVAGGLLIGLTDHYLAATRSAVFLGVLTGLLTCIHRLDSAPHGSPATVGEPNLATRP